MKLAKLDGNIHISKHLWQTTSPITGYALDCDAFGFQAAYGFGFQAAYGFGFQAAYGFGFQAAYGFGVIRWLLQGEPKCASV